MDANSLVDNAAILVVERRLGMTLHNIDAIDNNAIIFTDNAQDFS